MLAAATAPQRQPLSVSIPPAMISDENRDLLVKWGDVLGSLLERYEACPARTRNRGLEIQLRSAINGAYDTLSRVAAPVISGFVDDAVAVINSYFSHIGDARVFASDFEAIRLAEQFFTAPSLNVNLIGLVNYAKHTRVIITEVLQGGVAWHFTAAKGERIMRSETPCVRESFAAMETELTARIEGGGYPDAASRQAASSVVTVSATTRQLTERLSDLNQNKRALEEATESECALPADEMGMQPSEEKTK